MMAFPIKRRLVSGHFAVDNGTGSILDACPCCAMPLNEVGADKVIAMIAAGEMTFDAAMALVELLRAHRANEATRR